MENLNHMRKELLNLQEIIQTQKTEITSQFQTRINDLEHENKRNKEQISNQTKEIEKLNV